MSECSDPGRRASGLDKTNDKHCGQHLTCDWRSLSKLDMQHTNLTKHDQDVQPMPGLSTALLICSVTCNTHSFLKTTLLSHADGLTWLLTFVLLCSSTATFPVILNSMLPQLQPLQTCLMHAHPTTKYSKSFNTSLIQPLLCVQILIPCLLPNASVSFAQCFGQAHLESTPEGLGCTS